MRRWAHAATLAIAASSLTIATPAFAADTDIRINEVQSTGATPDFVELINTGAAAVDISGWVFRDSDDTHDHVIPADTILDPGEFFVIEPDAGTDGFGLGSDDSARLFLGDGATMIDSHSWTDHAESEGRVPDGTGAFVSTSPTPGAANAERAVDSPFVINEIESNGDSRGDWVELANTDTTNTLDVSGWTIIDSDPTHTPITLPAGTTIESGGYLGVVTDASFGLGGEDSITVRNDAGELVATISWSAHAATTLGRCPDMTGAFADTAAGTFELVNDCDSTEPPPTPDTEPWPYGNDVEDAVAPGTWGEDMSGLDFAPDGTLFAVNNDNAEIFKLAQSGNTFTIAESWIPTYPDGSGQPDAEGITIAGDSSVFLSTERDNENSSVSRPSVLRVTLGANGASTTTHEWNLSSVVGTIGANAGIEAIEWISDADAVRLGVKDQGAAYSPAAFGDHFGGIFVASVEGTGALHVLVLEADGTFTVLQSVTANADVPILMGLDWQPGGNALIGLCDEACENRHSTFAFVDGTLTWQANFDAPSGMNPSFTNEGIAIRWCAVDPAATPTTHWISDTAHDGVSLRIAPGSACVAATNPIGGGNGNLPVLPAVGAETGPMPLIGGALLSLAGLATIVAAARRRPSAA